MGAFRAVVAPGTALCLTVAVPGHRRSGSAARRRGRCEVAWPRGSPRVFDRTVPSGRTSQGSRSLAAHRRPQSAVQTPRGVSSNQAFRQVPTIQPRSADATSMQSMVGPVDQGVLREHRYMAQDRCWLEQRRTSAGDSRTSRQPERKPGISGPRAHVVDHHITFFWSVMVVCRHD